MYRHVAVRESDDDFGRVRVTEPNDIADDEQSDSPAVVEASREVGGCVVDAPVYRRNATGGGDGKALRHAGIPTVEFGVRTRTAHGTDEYTTTDALVRNATAYAVLLYRYDQQVSDSTG